MSRYKGRPSKATIEAAHRHAVWIRVPAMPGLGENLNRLHDAAKATGTYATTGRMQGTTDWVRFGFTTAKDAKLFRTRAMEIVDHLVEPGEPPGQTPTTRKRAWLTTQSN